MVNVKAFVLLSNDGSNGLRINEIGPETVKAWKVLCADWQPASDGRKKRALHDVPSTSEVSNDNL